MIYSKIENGFIVNKVSSSSQPDGYVLDTSNSHVGERRDFFDDNWNRKSLSVLVSEGIEEIPTGYKLSDDGSQFIELSDAEKIEAGLLVPTEREKLVDGKIVPKTMAELYADGIINKENYNTYIVGCRVSEYTNSDKIFWDYQRGEATKDEWVTAVKAIKEKYQKV